MEVLHPPWHATDGVHEAVPHLHRSGRCPRVPVQHLAALQEQGEVGVG